MVCEKIKPDSTNMANRYEELRDSVSSLSYLTDRLFRVLYGEESMPCNSIEPAYCEPPLWGDKLDKLAKSVHEINNRLDSACNILYSHLNGYGLEER